MINGSLKITDLSASVHYAPILCKKIIKEKLVAHLTDNDLLSPAQFGFTKGKSCQLQLLESLEDWTKSLDHGKDVDVIFYDFKKAFDTLSHSKLILKLESYGIIGNILHWIKDFLTNRTQEVVINQVHSSTQKVLSGVPQGSVLGPVLFRVFINDLPDLAEITVRLSADDSKAYSIINTDNDVENLQRTTDKFYDWSIKWDMGFNEKKCKGLHLGKKEANHNYFMKTKDLNRIQISNVKEENDLGVIIDNKLTFDVHISSKINIANRYLGIKNFKFMDNTMFIH